MQRIIKLLITGTRKIHCNLGMKSCEKPSIVKKVDYVIAICVEINYLFHSPVAHIKLFLIFAMLMQPFLLHFIWLSCVHFYHLLLQFYAVSCNVFISSMADAAS